MKAESKENIKNQKKKIILHRMRRKPSGIKMGGIPILDVEEAIDMLCGKFGYYPLYAFFLYSESDADLAEFMRLRGQWLHSLSGDDCLIGVFENPGEWGEGWERYWQKKFSSNFSQISAKWMKLKPYDRNTAFFLAEQLNIEKSSLPCIVFVESFSQKEVMCIPMIADKNSFPKYFQDVFTAVGFATKAPAGTRLRALQSEWRKVWGSKGWVKWILPERIKDTAKSIQEWGSIINETKKAFVYVINPIEPIMQLFKDIFTKEVDKS